MKTIGYVPSTYDLVKARDDWAGIASAREKEVADRIASIAKARELLSLQERSLEGERARAAEAFKHEAEAFEAWKIREEEERALGAVRRAKLLKGPVPAVAEEGGPS